MSPPNLNLLPIFMIGVLGSVHCIGMCGGIVSAISLAAQPAHRFPVPIRRAETARPTGGIDRITGIVMYNAGRIGSYALAGAIAGGAARAALALTGMAQIQSIGYWLANSMLVALGVYLMGATRSLAWLEAGGQRLWRQIQPLTRNVLPLDTPWKMLLAGSLWGWLPCGMVYSMLLTALLTGSAATGATVMLVFGLGTLPMLFALGILGAHLRSALQRRPVRLLSGLIVLSFGLLGLFRIWHGMPIGWLDALCVSAPMWGAR